MSDIDKIKPLGTVHHISIESAAVLNPLASRSLSGSHKPSQVSRLDGTPDAQQEPAQPRMREVLYDPRSRSTVR